MTYEELPDGCVFTNKDMLHIKINNSLCYLPVVKLDEEPMLMIHTWDINRISSECTQILPSNNPQENMAFMYLN